MLIPVDNSRLPSIFEFHACYQHVASGLGMLPTYGVRLGHVTNMWRQVGACYQHVASGWGMLPTYGVRLGHVTNIWRQVVMFMHVTNMRLQADTC